jgi:hypothetical protein
MLNQSGKAEREAYSLFGQMHQTTEAARMVIAWSERAVQIQPATVVTNAMKAGLVGKGLPEDDEVISTHEQAIWQEAASILNKLQ